MVSKLNLVFSLTAAFIGCYCWELSSVIEPTRIGIGLRITNTFTNTIANDVLCETDRGDNTVQFTQQNPGRKSVWTIELTYETPGHYNISVECFNETRAFKKRDNAYNGAALLWRPWREILKLNN